MYEIVFTKRAKADIEKLKKNGLDKKAKNLITVLKENPYQTPPSYMKLKGDFVGAFSRRIIIQHRIVYQVNDEKKIVKIILVYSHYG